MNRNIVWTDLADHLMAALRPIAAPIGIAFVPQGAASDAPPFDESYPAPNVSGRTGAVSAGCVFWMRAVERMFSTDEADHANCSVGSYVPKPHHAAPKLTASDLKVGETFPAVSP